MLEKALVDEHQYRTGKNALDSELKVLLSKHQESLEPNDKVPLTYFVLLFSRSFNRVDRLHLLQVCLYHVHCLDCLMCRKVSQFPKALSLCSLHATQYAFGARPRDTRQ